MVDPNLINNRKEELLKKFYVHGALVDEGGGRMQSSRGLSLMDLHDFAVDDLNDLTDRGVLTELTDEFGEDRWLLDPRKLRVQIRKIAGRSEVDADADRGVINVTHFAKLELVYKLFCEGWTISDVRPAAYTADGPKALWGAKMMSSKWYLIALTSASHIFRKGLHAIDHDRPEAYFKCIFSLKNLDMLLAIEAKGRRPNRIYEGALKDKLTVEELRALDDGPPIPAIEGRPVEDDDDILALPEPPPMELVPLNLGGMDHDEEAKELWIDLKQPLSAAAPDGTVIKVLFDGFSHQSHLQRGWVDCHHAHADGLKCHKYQYVPRFSSRGECAAWLYAWALMGAPEQTRKQHYKQCPHAADVAKYNAELFSTMR